MKLLLDTHALLWTINDPDTGRMSRRARDAVEDPTNNLCVSAATAWELATKHRLGRLPEAATAVRRWPAIITSLGAIELAITTGHAMLAGGLPGAHGDPFDRVLAAQAIIEGAHLVTADRAMDGFGAQLLW